ncbi:unnamed protein product, partial [Amoebophrya sp. A120]|eukprot:GSA120T00026163001.1
MPLSSGGNIAASGSVSDATTPSVSAKQPEDEDEFYNENDGSSDYPVHPSNANTDSSAQNSSGDPNSSQAKPHAVNVIPQSSITEEMQAQILQKRVLTKEDNNEIYWRLSKIQRNNRIVLTSVDKGSITWLKNWLRRAKYSMKQGGLGIVLSSDPQQQNSLDLQCKSVAS